MEGTKIKSPRSKPSKIHEKLKTRTIKQKEFIPVEPGEVYDALLDEHRHSEFTGARATCDRRVGGKFTAWDGYIRGKNVKLENRRRIIQEWRTTEWPKGYAPSIVELKLKPKGAGTEVQLVQKNVPAVQAESYKKGWISFYWTPLKKYFGRLRAT